MQPPKLIEELSARLTSLIESSPVKDIEKNVRTAMGGVFNRLDLVTREEFEVQSELLLRTREQLVALEKRVAALEARLGPQPDTASSRGPAAVDVPPGPSGSSIAPD
jgi:ubiquinone biosynthesis accessory factor UbiK